MASPKSIQEHKECNALIGAGRLFTCIIKISAGRAFDLAMVVQKRRRHPLLADSRVIPEALNVNPGWGYTPFTANPLPIPPAAVVKEGAVRVAGAGHAGVDDELLAAPPRARHRLEALGRRRQRQLRRRRRRLAVDAGSGGRGEREHRGRRQHQKPLHGAKW